MDPLGLISRVHISRDMGPRTRPHITRDIGPTSDMHPPSIGWNRQCTSYLLLSLPVSIPDTRYNPVCCRPIGVYLLSRTNVKNFTYGLRGCQALKIYFRSVYKRDDKAIIRLMVSAKRTLLKRKSRLTLEFKRETAQTLRSLCKSIGSLCKSIYYCDEHDFEKLWFMYLFRD